MQRDLTGEDAERFLEEIAFELWNATPERLTVWRQHFINRFRYGSEKRKIAEKMEVKQAAKAELVARRLYGHLWERGRE